MMDKVATILIFTWMFFIALISSIEIALRSEKIRELSDELTFYKEKYEQLKLDQIQELLDDRDFGNND